jgi:hypothetical protein
MWYWLVEAIADRNVKNIALAVVALLGMTTLLALFVMAK